MIFRHEGLPMLGAQQRSMLQSGLTMNSVPLRGRVYTALRVALGIQARDERALTGRLIVAFHGIFPRLRGDGFDTFALDQATFESHLDQLQTIGRVVSLGELRAARDGLTERPLIALTFDDALKCHAGLAADILRARRLPWSLGAPAGLVGSDRAIWSMELRLLIKLGASMDKLPMPNDDALLMKSLSGSEIEACTQRIHRTLMFKATAQDRDRYLQQLIDCVGVDRFMTALKQDDRLAIASWDDIRALQSDGVEILSHGWLHRPLNRLADDQTLRTEVVSSRQKIEQEVGARPVGFVFPHGVCSAECQQTVNASYDFALTSQPN